MTNNQGFFCIINITNNNFNADGEMKIYVVGSSKNKFLPLDNIREKFLIDQPHEGDNIDFLNPWYCELTGLYYLWKHVDDDIVGLEHYRRYFTNCRNRLLNETEIKGLLQKYDVITCHYNSPKCVYESYKNHKFGMYEYFYLFNTFQNKEKVKNYLCHNDTVVFNMFICKKEIINKYCDWFFNNIFELPLDQTKRRKIGYLGEYIFGAWLIDNNYKMCNSKFVVKK